MTTELKAKKKTTEQWQTYIGTSLRRTAEATLDTAKRVSEYKLAVDEDTFITSMKAWFGFSPSHVSYWSKIADMSPRFAGNTAVLPSSPRTLYELSGIDDSLWDELVESGDINPSVTVEGAKSLKITGGFKKATARKYGEADNFLDIMQQLDTIMSDANSIKDTKKALKIWLKDNPAIFLDDEPTEPLDKLDLSEDGEELSDTPKVSIKKIPGTSSQLRVKCLAAFGIYVDKPIVNKDFLTFLDSQAGNDESLIAMIATLESE